MPADSRHGWERREARQAIEAARLERPDLILMDLSLPAMDGWEATRRLKEDEIHIYGKICAIADVFDALTSSRPYKDPWPIDRAANLIREESGKHFDPELVRIFENNFEEILRVKSGYGET